MPTVHVGFLQARRRSGGPLRPLHHIAHRGLDQRESINALMGHGGGRQPKTRADGLTPLLVALQSGNSAAARYLVDTRAPKMDVNLAGGPLHSALPAAASRGEPDLVARLL